MYRSIVLIALTTSLFICGCGNSDGDESDLEEGTIVAQIDGKNFSSNTGFGLIISVLNSQAFTITTVLLQSDPEVLNIGFNLPSSQMLEEIDYISTNCGLESGQICSSFSYGFSEDSNTPIQYYYSIEDDFNISFESLDYNKGGHAIGTFSGTIVSDEVNSDTLTVTDGKFNVLINE